MEMADKHWLDRAMLAHNPSKLLPRWHGCAQGHVEAITLDAMSSAQAQVACAPSVLRSVLSTVFLPPS